MLKKLLVCAPSNAAVDELVLRLKEGVRTLSGSFHRIDVIRLGRSDAINAAVKDVTLDELAKARLEAEINKAGGVSEREKMHQEAGEIKAEMADLRPRLEAARAGEDRAATNTLQREFDALKRRQAIIGARIDASKDSGNTYAREMEIKRRQIQQEILDKADVLCATLSGSGHEMFRNLNVEFETVIIDEAAQCVELSCLIPLKYGCSKCVLVGDPKQLPPTVLSRSAARFGYDQSLFVRMQANRPTDVHLLDQQYRMHPEISLFPSQEFYEGRLFDGDDMAKLRRQPWHDDALLGPYRFFDVRGVQEKGHKGRSLVNVEEVKVAVRLYQRFRASSAAIGHDMRGRIGIITPYKAQLHELRRRFSDRYGDTITEEIEFNTTDAFQGRECEIIIFSCVRASPTGGIGFVNDIRRMNVGLTRAKSSLWILGDSLALAQGEFWARLIKDAKHRDRYTSGDVVGLLKQPAADLPAPAPFVAPGPHASVQAAEGGGDVEMKDGDADTGARRRSRQQTIEAAPRLPEAYTLVNRAANASPGSFYRSKALGGFNEKGEALPVTPRREHPPVVHSTSETPGPAAKKRTLEQDGGGVHPAAKRVCETPAVGFVDSAAADQQHSSSHSESEFSNA
jgi:senataxin